MLALVPSSCIKEDRDSCPCVLVISTEGSEELCSVYLSREEEPVTDSLRTGVEYRRPVSRGFLYATVALGDGETFVHGKGIVIPKGEDCPPVRLWSRPVKAVGETVSRKAVLSKDYCLVRMRLVPSGGGLEFTVRGDIAGFDLDGSPAEGEFECTPRASEDGFLEFRLPRQTDNSLLMDVFSDGVLLRTFALGEILFRAGYSWKDKDLKDISMEVSCTASVLLTDFSIWENVENREILL
ncbi:MAG: hypothetical protein IKP46_05050 [Bacteroidales bacterium]|nr:hypothetical protein [Bacteroidales bacterium]